MEYPKHLEERIGKLPRWAVEYINKLHRDIEDAREWAKSIQDEESRVRYYQWGEGRRYLPSNVRVEFETGASVICCNLLVNGELRIQGGGPILIEPVASNAIHIR